MKTWATGFLRACVVAAATLLVPAVWAGCAALGLWWGGWAWLAPVVWAVVGTLLLARPVSRWVRALVEAWTGTTIPAGYRQAVPVTQMSTGYWWNGFSYEKTQRDALREQHMRLRWTDPATWRDLRFTVIAPAAGIVAALPVAGIAAAILWSPFFAVLTVITPPYAWRALPPLAARFLRPTKAMALADRVDELTAQRADTTIAQAAEIRRIERDLHDGAQARLVMLGLSLATAEKLMETDPDQAKVLLREARAGAATSLTELRDLIRGISPPVLNERGLMHAVQALAMDSALETTVTIDLDARFDPPIESAVYFGIAELLTNAVKHAHATHAHIALTHSDNRLAIEVEDNGNGGAQEGTGGGLAGLRRRLAAFDGTLRITSPSGGPTRATIELPCASL